MPALTLFNDRFGDVILCSAEGKEMRCSKAVLAKASCIFADMFLLPDHPNPGSLSSKEYRDGAHIVHVTESTSTLDALLRFCHPTRAPTIQTVDLALAIHDAAKKYEIEDAMWWARDALAALATKEPVRVYAIACQLGWECEAKAAARASLSLSLDDIVASRVKELGVISAEALQRLCVYHAACRKSVKHLSQPRFFVKKSWSVWDPLWSKEACCDDRVVTTTTPSSPVQEKFFVREWWCGYMEEVHDALQTIPAGKSAHLPEAMCTAVAKARSCSTCAPAAFESLNNLAEQLAADVEVEISKIQLKWIPTA